jgi:hypothetical protein
MQERSYRKARRRRKLPLYFDDFIPLDYQKRPFGYYQGISRNVACYEKLTANRAASVDVRAIEACEILKTRWRNRIADFLAYLPDDTFEKRFITFAVAAEETHLARMQDTGNIVASLE